MQRPKINKVEPEYFARTHSFTVGDLLDYIEKNNIPRDGLVFMQRIEDKYFEGCDISGMTGQLPDGTYGPLPEGSKAQGWATIVRPTYERALWEKKVADMKANPEEYPKITPEILQSYEEMLKDESMFISQYTNVNGPVGYDDYKHLYLDAHY